MSIEAATWAQQPVALNRFGALYRDVLFGQIAPEYRDRPRRIYPVPLQKKKEAPRAGRRSSRATPMGTATATRWN
jgi:hypothetical protein